jgi:hypothetical protein
MGKNFLENLKKAVEDGDFNSDAAKKIIEINELADTIAPTGDAEANLEKRLKEAGVKTVTEEEAALINSEYEKKMEEVKKQDAVTKQLATLIDIEEMVKASIDDMQSYIEELEHKFEKEFTEENPMFGELYQKIDEIKSKYKSIINN